jgi:Ohr subfamily peroxiredoxin
MPESIAYTAVATSDGDGRNGHVRSNDGLIDTDVRTPKEMGGAGGATNPEQLFAAGYAACFHSALQGVARARKVKIADSSVGSRVSI